MIDTSIREAVFVIQPEVSLLFSEWDSKLWILSVLSFNECVDEEELSSHCQSWLLSMCTFCRARKGVMDGICTAGLALLLPRFHSFETLASRCVIPRLPVLFYGQYFSKNSLLLLKNWVLQTVLKSSLLRFSCELWIKNNCPNMPCQM